MTDLTEQDALKAELWKQHIEITRLRADVAGLRATIAGLRESANLRVRYHAAELADLIAEFEQARKAAP